MSHRITLLLKLTCLITMSSCMDINPPLKVDADSDQLLHSVVLPFEKGVYGVGDSDSLAVFGILVTGDTIQLDPLDLKWVISPTTSALQVDSVGRIKAIQTNTSIANNGLTLTVSYTLGETTRSDAAKIYITTQKYEIDKFELSSPDSARSGSLINSYVWLSLLQGQILNIPRLNTELKDIDGVTPPQVNYMQHFTQFLTDFETGKRYTTMKVNYVTLFNYPAGLYIFANAPLGKYWLGTETYMYGKHIKDSILFTQLPSAEFSILISQTTGLIESSGKVSVAQPCATAIAYNPFKDTVYVELPPADVECEGQVSSPEGRIAIRPGFRGKIRTLGYASGSTQIWKSFSNSTSQTPNGSGTIKSQAGATSQ